MTPLLTKNDAYVVDTIVIAGSYKRTSASTQVDTLYIELVYGDTSNVSSWTNYKNAAISRARVSLPRLNGSLLHGNKSHLTGSNKLIFKKLLTEADSVDAASSRFRYLTIEVPSSGLSVPKDNIFAITYTFVPGAAYATGDVAWQSSSTAQTPQVQNGFSGVVLSQANTVTAAMHYFVDSVGVKARNAYVTFLQVQRYLQANTTFNACMYYDDNTFPIIWATISGGSVGVNNVTSPKLAILSQNMPNPFSDATTISYELTESANVSLNVFDITGKKVQSIEEGKKQAGSHAMIFSAGNLQAGVYFYTLTAGETRLTKRMTIVK